MHYFKKTYIYKKINKYIKLESKSDIKLLNIKIKWILSQSKPIIPYLIGITLINSSLSLIGVYNALVSKSLIDSAISGNTPKVIQWLIVMATIMFGRMLISPMTTIMSTRTTNNFNNKMQKRLYEHVSYSQWLPLSKHHSISLLTRINADVGTISSALLNTLPSLVSLIVTFIASFSTLAYFAPSIAIAAIIMGPILFIISRVFGSKLKALYKAIQEETVKYKSFMQETMQNLMIVKTFCMEKRNIKKLEEIQKNKFDLAMKNTKLGIMSGLSMGLCSSIVYFIIFCWGALNISKGTSTYGTFTAMLQLYNNVQGPLSSLAYMFPTFIGCIAAAERLMELEELPLEDYTSTLNESKKVPPNIKFKNVSFEYKLNNPVIKNINLTIKPGEIIGLVGPSGEGKTTLIRLLLSLIYPTAGEISISGEPLNRKHRELISYVPQGNTLFSGTIKENLLYGKGNASWSDIEDATLKACADDFIKDLQDGYNTILGEKGVGISEGQAQRIAIARAFLRKRPILILDEVTSSLDVETELKILNSIKELTHHPICIIITHRPSALQICERVYKLKGGYLEDIKTINSLETAIS